MKDPVSALTHIVAAVLAIPVTIFLIIKGVINSSVTMIVSFSIFGAALILLYTASSLYHSLKISEKATLVFKRIDHMMIFVLIAGTYTPICLLPLKGVWGYSLLVSVWLIAVIGILIKAFWIKAPRMLSTSIYIAMGWLVIIAFVPLIKSLSISGFTLLALGGVLYTLGGVIYALKWPKLNFKYFGFHEIFHIFVMLGSTMHTLLMFNIK